MTSGASATNSAAYFAVVLGIACDQPIIDPHIVAVGPTQLLQPLQECRDAYIAILIVPGQARKHADAPHAIGLLRTRRHRPRCRRAAEQRDELAPLSFDHLVGAGEQRRRHVEAECLGGLEVQHRLVFRRCLHW